jgi:endonuclease/exonuclease/phosphatase family metal-dependent hydrolase
LFVPVWNAIPKILYIEQNKEKTVLKIASYNIRKCIGLDRKRNPLRILSVLNDLSMDVVALQEADKRLGQRPSSLPVDQIEHYTGLVPLKTGRSGPSLGWHGNAVLFKPNAKFADIECLDLPGLEPRGAIIVDLDLPQKPPVRLVTVHLGLLRNSRHRQIDYIRDAVSNRSHMPTVITGDFNEWSASRGLEKLSADFKILSPGNSFHSARPVARLDRFALSKELAIHDAGVIDTGLARRASDHLPIWADLKLLQNAA